MSSLQLGSRARTLLPCVGVLSCLGVMAHALLVPLGAANPGDTTTVVKPTVDFEVTGDGAHPAWVRAEWIPLRKRTADGHAYTTRIKLLHSPTGLYVLMDATDQEVTSSMSADYMDLWKEDVFEVFLWTDERWPIYFEYEISPRGYELPILVPNFDDKFLGWQPWHYEGSRRTRKATSTVGGPREPGARIQGWKAEVFIPYELLSPLQNVPPGPGSKRKWRANFYRVDHDGGKPTAWDWAPVGPSFHEYKRFGTLIFE